MNRGDTHCVCLQFFAPVSTCRICDAPSKHRIPGNPQWVGVEQDSKELQAVCVISKNNSFTESLESACLVLEQELTSNAKKKKAMVF